MSRSYTVATVGAPTAESAIRGLTVVVRKLMQEDGWEPCGGVSITETRQPDGAGFLRAQYFVAQALVHD